MKLSLIVLRDTKYSSTAAVAPGGWCCHCHCTLKLNAGDSYQE